MEVDHEEQKIIQGYKNKHIIYAEVLISTLFYVFLAPSYGKGDYLVVNWWDHFP